jgi:outer membrane lipoprotein carrier protein
MHHRFYVILLFFCSMVYADGVSSLKQFLRQKNGFFANFTQQVYSKHTVLKSTGSITLLRPNMFIWQYNKSNDNFGQKIISDGKYIYIIDSELEQVTYSKINKLLGASPALILAGCDDIDKYYYIKNIDTKDLELDWINLSPKNIDSNNGFQSIDIAFSKLEHNLVKMNFIDSFGSKSSIIFYNQTIKKSINADIFKFIKPNGYDLIDNS